MVRAFQLLVVLRALTLTVHSAKCARGQPVDALLVLGSTARAASTSRNSSCSGRAMRPRSRIPGCSTPSPPPHRRIAVCFVEWSGVGAQKVVIDWTLIGDAGRHAPLATSSWKPRSFADRTSISGAIDFAAALFDRAPYDSTRRTIDVSGDGNNNSGRDVSAARDDAVAQGIAINGLVILTPPEMAMACIQSTPTRPGAWPTTIATTSSAVRALSSSSRRTSTPFRRRSPKR